MATTSSTLWNAVVLRIGKGAQDMLDTGVIVLFGEPVPDALSDICVIHNRGGRSPLAPQRELLPGDVLNFADTRYTIDEVGEAATSNLSDLGHVCLLYTSPSPRDLSTSRMPSSA